MVRRHELLLRDLRAYLREQSKESLDKGVLGSRGMTEFCIDTIKQSNGVSVQWLLSQAERAGYAVPTSRTLSKRLTERAYRTGDIAYGKQRGWYWKSSS